MAYQSLADRTHQAFHQSPFHLQIEVSSLVLPTPLELAQGNDTAHVWGRILTLFRNHPAQGKPALQVNNAIEIHVPHCIPKSLPQYFVQGGFNILAEGIQDAKYLEVVLDNEHAVIAGLIKPINKSYGSPWLAEQNWMFL